MPFKKMPYRRIPARFWAHRRCLSMTRPWFRPVTTWITRFRVPAPSPKPNKLQSDVHCRAYAKDI